MLPPFEAGDVVRLKSGGIPMTIVGLLRRKRDVRCAWFDASNRLHIAVFAADMLTYSEPGTVLGTAEQVEQISQRIRDDVPDAA